MDAHSKHLKRLAEDYIIPNKDLPKYTPSVKTDFEVLQENYRFLRTEKDDRQQGDSGKLARAYDNLLFKEFCLADVSNTKRKGVGMRWRTEAEVRSGKGSTICGCVDCQNVENLTQYEVDFARKSSHRKLIIPERIHTPQNKRNITNRRNIADITIIPPLHLIHHRLMIDNDSFWTFHPAKRFLVQLDDTISFYL
ncbi:putative FRA10AC1 protein [Blattamonas nauphoetae]|uniref:FRA10AC1 protein n=1 Tax=Blattamonas nauphoetae TaxID=2049346 RepID=A0ABQ9YKE1_9EUKA|nr:putative FRA10AC1 protein [Blattamonas nauphoetae]